MKLTETHALNAYSGCVYILIQRPSINRAYVLLSRNKLYTLLQTLSVSITSKHTLFMLSRPIVLIAPKTKPKSVSVKMYDTLLLCFASRSASCVYVLMCSRIGNTTGQKSKLYWVMMMVVGAGVCVVCFPGFIALSASVDVIKG